MDSQANARAAPEDGPTDDEYPAKSTGSRVSTVAPALGAALRYASGGKQCSKCGEIKALDEFGPDGRHADGRQSRCRECDRKHDRLRYAVNPKKKRAASRRRYAADPKAYRARTRKSEAQRYVADKKAVFDHYGWSCACCGGTPQLSIDHVNGDGATHRKEIGIRGGGRTPVLYRWLVANDFPEGFQILCRPCNGSKGAGAACQLDHSQAVNQ